MEKQVVMNNKILEYQKLDYKLSTLERKGTSTKEQEALSKLSAMYKDVQNKLVALESQAKELHDTYQATYKEYEGHIKKVNTLTGADTENLDEAALAEKLESANKISSDIFMLERKLNQILTNSNAVLKEFETAKTTGIQVRKRHADAKAALEQTKASAEPEKEELARQLKTMEGGLDKALFEKYKAMKHDNVFPVFVPLVDKRCGYCRVELPSSKIDELKNVENIVCEQCARLIYS